MKIPAVTLWQPWARLVVNGNKKYETRSWTTSHRGVLAIHAAQRWNQELEAIAKRPLFNNAIAQGSGDSISECLSFGAVIGFVRVNAVEIITPDFVQGLIEQEMEFGDYRPGRFAWQLCDPVMLFDPIPTRGYQRLWNWIPGEGYEPRVKDALNRMRQRR